MPYERFLLSAYVFCSLFPLLSLRLSLMVITPLAPSPRFDSNVIVNNKAHAYTRVPQFTTVPHTTSAAATSRNH